MGLPIGFLAGRAGYGAADPPQVGMALALSVWDEAQESVEALGRGVMSRNREVNSAVVSHRFGLNFLEDRAPESTPLIFGANLDFADFDAARRG